MKRRALFSVYDKTGVVEFARELAGMGWDLLSSGGTASALREAGLAVTETADFTGFPAILGHRVVTLHPKVHGGILADRDVPEHLEDLDKYGIEPIDLVVGNLYPFGSDPSIEMIDVGGPAMVRAAAKNHAHVGVVTDPADYPIVLDELKNEGALSAKTRRALALTAFQRTAAYDAAIAGWLTEDDAETLPASINLTLERAEDKLRYGENPHQKAARYRTAGAEGWWEGVQQHGGLPLSYLNFYDADAAWRIVHDLGDSPACVIIKHANPCGAAVSGELADAYGKALESDEKSAFGGIVAFNRTLDASTVERMVAGPQADVVIAPGYDPGTIEALSARRKNTRLLEASAPGRESLDFRQISGGFLVQQAPRYDEGSEDWKVVTEARPTEEQWRDIELVWRLCGHVKSNCVLLAKDGATVGIGAGQMSRIDSSEIAVKKAGGRVHGAVAASDAFFPFADGVEELAEAGVSAIIQPGGSMRDEEVIAAADERGVAMVFTGRRHFLH